MSDIRNWTKEFLTEFINIYRGQPCLWKIKDKKVYTNRNLKTIAYDLLTDYSKTVYPEANRAWVVSRIQSLRGSFRKEFNKSYETKNKSGSSADSVHIPSLWYYNQLLFTKEQEMPEESISNISDDENNDSIAENSQKNLISEDNYIDNNEKINDDNLITVKETSTIPSPYFAVKETQKKRKKDDSQLFVKTITQAIQGCKDIDEYEAFGICVAAKVRKMSETQYLMAEPLINLILSKGLSNHLTPDTVIGQQNSIDYSHGHGQSSGIPMSTNSYTAQPNTIANSTLSYTYPESLTFPAINNKILSKGPSNHLTPDTVIGQQNSIDYSHGHGQSSGIPMSTNSYTAQPNTIANSTLSYTYPESLTFPAINNKILSKGPSNYLTPDTVIGQQNSIDYSHGHGQSSGISTNCNRIDDEPGDNSEDDSSLIKL